MKTLHELVADKLERADGATREALLRIPLDNIERWLANGGKLCGARRPRRKAFRSCLPCCAMTASPLFG
jgi:hypothetical protein